MEPRVIHTRRGLAVAVVYLLLATVGTVVYWTVFFTSGAVHVSSDAAYLAFERAFPLADGWMAACALLGAVGLLKRRPWGLLFGLLAGSSLVFLGCMDVLWNLNTGAYARMSAPMLGETVINLFCVVGGPWLIAWLWGNRHSLA
jgi:hypothetical protein